MFKPLFNQIRNTLPRSKQTNQTSWSKSILLVFLLAATSLVFSIVIGWFVIPLGMRLGTPQSVSKTEPNSQITLTQSQVHKTIIVELDGNTTEDVQHQFDIADIKVHQYLDSIQNRSDYQVQIRTISAKNKSTALMIHIDLTRID